MLNRFEYFTATVSAIYRDVQKIERDEMEKRGLRGAVAQYLLALSRHPEGLTATGLCEACDKDKAAVSRIIAEMEDRGLLEKESDGASQYRARLRLTSAGQEAAAFVRERASAAMELMEVGISPEELQDFYATLERIAANVQQICQQGIP